MTLDLRWFLRERTGAAHSRLDATIDQFVDPKGYGDYVRAIFRFREPLERAIAEILPTKRLGNFRPARLVDAIAADLADLKLAVPEVASHSPDLRGSRLVGALYVLEGAALGARVLIKRANALGFSAEHGARHLALAAGSTTWPSFLALIGDADNLDRDSAADAALATFDMAQRAFESVPA